MVIGCYVTHSTTQIKGEYILFFDRARKCLCVIVDITHNAKILQNSLNLL